MATTIFEQQTLTGFVFDSNNNAYTNGLITPAPFIIESGSNYSVCWGDKTFTCQAFDFVLNEMNIVAIGNGRAVGMETPDYPFFITYNLSYDMIQFFTDKPDESHIVTIYKIEDNDVVLKNYYGTPKTYDSVNYVALRNANGGTTMFVGEHLVQNQVQADWAQTDETAVDYIKNKPESELPKATTDDNGKVLGVVDGIWSKIDAPSGGGNCSCPTGTIEKETKIEYTMTEVPSVSCDFLDGAKLYKLSDTTFSKEELLLSEWTVQIPGQGVSNATWLESDIIVNTEDILMATKDGFIIAMCYKSGEITVEIDVDLIATTNIPEAGFYLIFDPAVIGYLLGTQITAKATIIEEVNFVQSNWNQNDCTKPDYIKNRPFYAGSAKEYDVLPKQTFAFERSDVGFNDTVSGFAWNETYQMYALQQNEPSFTLNSNTEYEVIWDNGEPLFCKTFEFTLDSDPSVWIGIGNGGAVGFEASTEPFMFAYNADYNILMLGTDSNLESHSIEIGEATPRVSGIQSTECKLEQGQVYHIAWDETVYECKSRVSSGNPADAVIGNMSTMHKEDTEDLDLPFGILYNKDNNVIFIVAYSKESSHTLRIYQAEENIKKIDPKFLPSIEWSKISNKPFDTVAAGTVLYDLNTVVCDIPAENEGVYYTHIDKIGFIEGAKYIVELDGAIYNCKGILSGNAPGVTGSTGTAMFGIADGFMQPEYATFIISAQGSHTLKISVEEDIVKKIDAKYLPDDIGGTPAIDTTADEGKFLRVVGGVAAWSTVPNAEEASF